jgi:hypothetical protein
MPGGGGMQMLESNHQRTDGMWIGGVRIDKKPADRYGRRAV